jgi:twinkle protein
MFDNFGSIEWEVIREKIRYMCHNYGVRIFYIDNLTALNAHASDERRNLDALMAEVATLAKELDIWILLVSHLNPPKSGASHEAGGKVEQNQFTGSRAIMRWAFFMMGVERNTLHPDPAERNKGLIRCIKDRFSGRATGHTIGFIYDTDSGLCLETDEDFDIETSEGEDSESDF